MSSSQGKDVIHLLGRVQGGDKLAADQLIQLVYEELREGAAAQLRRSAVVEELRLSSKTNRSAI